MPLVQAPKEDSDGLRYDNFRPEKSDLDEDNIRSQLDKIEAARDSSRSKSRSKRPTPRPPEDEPGCGPAQWDRENVCWKKQTMDDPPQLKVWDDKEGIWKTINKRFSGGSNVGLLNRQDRKESWIDGIKRRTSSWFGGGKTQKG